MTPGGGPPARRFALVGLLATLVDLGLAIGLTEAGWARLPADLVALVVAAAVSGALHGRVTLRGDTLERWIRRPGVFLTVAAFAGVVDLALFVGLDEQSPLVAKSLAIAGAAVIRALAHRLVLFRAVREEQSRPAQRPPATGTHRLSVVVPAYCEAARIGTTVDAIRSELAELDDAGELEIVVVDDGSTDDTAAAARAAGADVVVEHPVNRGKGAAVRTGVAAASGRVIAFTDADLAYAPHQLLPMLAGIEAGYDVVIGNRHDPASRTVVGTSVLRTLGSRAVNLATHLLLLGSYRDTQCGCKVFRADVARAVLGAGQVDGFAFDIEILHLVERYGLSLDEVPVAVVNSDTSTVRALRDGLGVGRDIFRIRRIARGGGYPDLAPDTIPAGAEADPPGQLDS